MKIIIFLTLLAASFGCKAQAAEGSMDCTVTGNIVVASEEGKFKTYSGIQGGVKLNEKVTLFYQVTNKSIYIELKREQVEKKIITNTFFSSELEAHLRAKVENTANGGFLITNSSFRPSLIFSQDYIRLKDLHELTISRYYKNDWHGIFVSFHDSDLSAQTLTLNCRHTNDKMDAAFKHLGDFKKGK